MYGYSRNYRNERNFYKRNNGYMKFYNNGSSVNVYNDRYGTTHREYYNANTGYVEHTKYEH